MDRSEIISQFQILFNASREEAKFYLEAANYDMDIAAEAYLSDKGTDVEGEASSISTPGSITTPSGVHAMMSNNVLTGNVISTANAPESSQPKSRITTFHTLNDARSSARDDDNSSEEEGQHFFVGGGGQEVLGPPKKRETKDKSNDSPANRQEFIRDIFKGARDSGAEVVQPSEKIAGSGSSSAFRGTGYRLGESLERPSEVLPSGSSSTANQPHQGNEEFVVIVKLWENGVSWNDEPLKPYEDPQAVSFVMSLRQGQIPTEILREARGRMVDLQMEDRRNEKYVAPPMKPFSGAGHKLGVPSPNVIGGQVTGGSSSSAPGSTSKPLPTDPVEAEGFNPNAPSTQVQIRLGDGSRLVARFNHSHTVADIRRILMKYHSASQERSFVLATTFPNKELTDETLTLVDAKLLGAAVLQRFK